MIIYGSWIIIDKIYWAGYDHMMTTKKTATNKKCNNQTNNAVEVAINVTMYRVQKNMITF